MNLQAAQAAIQDIVGWSHISDAEFQEAVLDAPGVVVVEFYRDSCSSCRMFTTSLVELQERYMGRMKFLRYNTDFHKHFQKKYNFESAPTTAVFYNGELQGAFVGASGFLIFEAEMLKIFAAMTAKHNLAPITRVA
jgi:thioredoxin 1